MRALVRDVRYALRQLRANPGFTLLAIVSLTIGIGAPTTIFTLVNAALLRPVPVRDADRLVFAYESSADGSGFHSFSYPQYRDLNARTRQLTGLAAFDVEALSVATTGDPQLGLGGLVSGNYFQVLGTSPQLGRFFAPDEDGPGTVRPAVVVSDAFWRSRLSADSGAVGRTIQVNGQAFTIVGVTRPEFASLSALIKPDLWTTMGTAAITRPGAHLDRRSYSTFQVVGRLASGVSRERAERELDGIARQISADHPDDTRGRGVDLYEFTTLPTEARSGVVVFMSLLLAFGALILFVACGNVASMLLARGIQRRHELAIRTALGAARGQLVAQLVVETVLLFLGGAAGAMVLVFYATRSIASFRLPLDIQLAFEVPLDWRVFGFALGVAIVVGLVFGLLPGLRATRVGVASVLKENSGRATGGSRARSAVVIGQLAFTVVLLVSAGLVVKALGSALTRDAGFDRTQMQLAMTDVQMARLDTAQSLAVATAWRDAVAATPGVTSVTLTTRAPLSTGNSTTSFVIPGAADRTAAELQSADYAAVSPEFFSTLGIRLVAGRGFTSGDTRSAGHVAIVSEAFARRYFTDPARAIGQVLRSAPGATTSQTIVGVAADTKVRSIAEAPRPMLYEPLAQTNVRKVTLLAKSSRPDIAVVIRSQLKRVNAALPVMTTMPYEQYIGVALLPQRLSAIVAGTLGIVGLLLAVLGVYGIVAYSVSQRTREIGIRMAVGATPASVVKTMTFGGLRLVAVGISLGLVLSVAATRLMHSFLLGISPTDPMVFGVTIAGLGAIAILACAVPASRAARVDPLVALRSN